MLLIEGGVNGVRWRVAADESTRTPSTCGDVRVEIAGALPYLTDSSKIQVAAKLAEWAQSVAATWRNHFGVPEVASAAGAPDPIGAERRDAVAARESA